MAKATLEGLTPEDINGLAVTARGLIDNPKTRGKFQRLLREDDPTLVLPEIDAADAAAERVKPLEDQVTKLTNDLAQRDARDRLNRLQREPVEAGLLKSLEELPDLEKYMKEKGFTPVQYLQAARYRQMERQLAEPTPPNITPHQPLLPKGDELKAWMQNPAQKAREVANQFLNESRANRGPRH